VVVLPREGWDVVVIGAGLGGLTCAALLAHEGLRVLVLEREARIGGRAASFRGGEDVRELRRVMARTCNEQIVRTEPSLDELPSLMEGYVIDLGFHEYSYHEHGRLGVLLKDLGEHVRFHPLKENLYFFDGKLCSMQPPRIEFLPDESTISEFWRVARLITSMNRTEAAKHDHESMKEFMESLTGSHRVREFWYLIATLVATINDPADISAGETIKSNVPASHVGAHAGRGNAGSIEGGFIEAAKALARTVEKHGGSVKTGIEVKEVVVEDGVAKGVVADFPRGEEHVESSVVVSNVPIQKVFSIVDRNVFPKGWVERVEKLASAGAVTGYAGLKKPVLKNRGYIYVPELIPEGEGFKGSVRFIFEAQSNFDPSRAPKGKQLFTFYCPLTPEEARSKSKVERVLDEAMNFVSGMFPEFDASVEWLLYASLDYLDGVARTPDQVGGKRPNVKAPGVENLYFVGDGVGGWGVPMDATVHSGFIAASMITGKNLLEKLPEYLR